MIAKVENRAAARMTEAQMAALLARAEAAGRAAGERAGVVPMIVSEADVLTGAKLPGGKSWYVADGVCGFAWIEIRPGYSRFAKWLRRTGRALKAHNSGVQIAVRDFNQSLQRKEAYAYAAAEVLREAGINAYGRSRID